MFNRSNRNRKPVRRARRKSALPRTGGANPLCTYAPNNSLFAPVYFAQMRFIENISVTANPRKDIVCIANDIYDPSGGDGAKPCYGLPELAAIYSTFLVHKSVCKVTWTSAVNGTAYHQVAIVPSLVSTALASFHEAMGHPLAVTGYLGPTDGGHNVKILTQSVDVKNFFGVPNLADYGSFAAGTGSGAPASKLYFHIFTENRDAAACTAVAQIEIRFWVQFSNLKHLDEAA